MSPNVLVIQGQLMKYRVPLFEKLQAELARERIGLRVAHAAAAEHGRGDHATLPPPLGLEVPGYRAFGGRLLYMPVLRAALAADLVIVEHANKHVVNHVLLPLAAAGWKKVALWGLGANKQADRTPISEGYKRLTSRWATWWFAYTADTARYLVEHGVPAARITSVNNAVDTRHMADLARTVGAAELDARRQALGIAADDPVGVYCGMLDPVKALPFLIQAARRVRTMLPGFHLILIGGGPERARIEKEIAETPWIHCAGPQFGRDKIVLMRLADALLVPGRVGLVILDGFATGLPLVTTELPNHGPELEYLERGVNGLAVEHDVDTYARAVSELLRDRARLAALQAGAGRAAAIYNIDAMAARFADGIRRCLATS